MLSKWLRKIARDADHCGRATPHGIFRINIICWRWHSIVCQRINDLVTYLLAYFLTYLLTYSLTGRVNKFVLPIHPDAFVVRNRYIYNIVDWSRCLRIISAVWILLKSSTTYPYGEYFGISQYCMTTKYRQYSILLYQRIYYVNACCILYYCVGLYCLSVSLGLIYSKRVLQCVPIPGWRDGI